MKDVKAVTGMFKQTFGGKSDVKDVLGAVTVSSPHMGSNFEQLNDELNRQTVAHCSTLE